MSLTRASRLIAVLAAAAGLAASPAVAGAHASKRHHHHSHGIPQHNGGDHDADNRGGPSDGDGNV
jgi:hypothetical protein